MVNNFAHVTDLSTTILDYAGIENLLIRTMQSI